MSVFSGCIFIGCF